MNYYYKYLKYKKKYMHLTGGNFGTPAAPPATDFTQNFFRDNILIHNNTLNIDHYKDFDQVFVDHFYTDFKDKIKHINILTPHILQEEILTLSLIQNLTNLEIFDKITNIDDLAMAPATRAISLAIVAQLSLPVRQAIPALQALQAIPALVALGNKYMIKSDTLKELTINDSTSKNLGVPPPPGMVIQSLVLNTTTSPHLPKLTKINIKGNCNIMDCTAVSEKKIEDLPELEEIIFDKDFDSDINLKNLQKLKSIIIKKPNFSKPIKLEDLPKLEIISVTNYTGDITFINMPNFINIFLSN